MSDELVHTDFIHRKWKRLQGSVEICDAVLSEQMNEIKARGVGTHALMVGGWIYGIM